jgi:hypothetical protein
MQAQGSAALASAVEGVCSLACERQELADRLAPLSAELLAAQQRGDWVGLADGLEFELVPLLLANG